MRTHAQKTHHKRTRIASTHAHLQQLLHRVTLLRKRAVHAHVRHVREFDVLYAAPQPAALDGDNSSVPAHLPEHTRVIVDLASGIIVMMSISYTQSCATATATTTNPTHHHGLIQRNPTRHIHRGSSACKSRAGRRPIPRRITEALHSIVEVGGAGVGAARRERDGQEARGDL